MAFFRTVSFSDPLPIVEGDGVFLRAPQMADFPEWAALREASRTFLTPWEPTWLHDDLTRGGFRPRIPLHQRRVAGPRALRAAQERCQPVSMRDRPWVRHLRPAITPRAGQTWDGGIE